jgi:hypothetical protein
MAVEKEDLFKDVHGKGVLVAQEIAFAKILAGNNKTLRDRGVKRLARWLKARSHGRCGMCAEKNLLIVGLCDVFPVGLLYFGWT